MDEIHHDALDDMVGSDDGSEIMDIHFGQLHLCISLLDSCPIFVQVIHEYPGSHYICDSRRADPERHDDLVPRPQ